MAADHHGRVPAAAAAARVEGWAAVLRAEVDVPTRTDPRSATPDLLEGARRDDDGAAFTRELLEAVIGTADPFTAALGLRTLSQDLPPSLPAKDRLAMRTGGIASLGLPWAVLPMARRWLRERVAHLVLAVKPPSETEALPERLGTVLRANREAGFDTVLALGGEPVLGPAGARRELERLRRLARDPGVARLAVDPARLVPSSSTATGCWALDTDAVQGAAALRSLLEVAREHGTVVVLEPSDYRGALLAPEMLLGALTAPAAGGARGPDPDFDFARTGLHLPAELPEATEIAERMIRFSQERVAVGAEPLELVVGELGLAPREQIASLLSGLAVPTLDDREAVHAQLLRLVGAALAAGAAVRTVVATEDPLLLAAATLAAEQPCDTDSERQDGRQDERHVGSEARQARAGGAAGRAGNVSRLGVQLRAGVAGQLAKALVEHGFTVRLRLPVLAPKEFAGAIDGLIHLALQAAEPDSPLGRAAGFAAGSEPGPGSDAVIAELERVLERSRESAPPSHRVQLRAREWDPGERDRTLFYRPPDDTERFDTGGLTAAVLGLGRDATGQIVAAASGPLHRVPAVSESGFACEPDTDASRVVNRAWAREALDRAVRLRAEWAAEGAGAFGSGGFGGGAFGSFTDAGDLAGPGETPGGEDPARDLAEAWRRLRPGERAARVVRLALGVASARDRLLTVLAAESGNPVASLDTDISGAIDSARYLGAAARGLGAVRGAEFRPDRCALVVADAGTSLTERAEALLAVIATGARAILVAHPSLARSSAALLEEWDAAGLPGGVATLAVARPSRAAHTDGEVDGHAGLAAALAADPGVDRAIVLGGRDTARSLIRHRPALRVEGRLRALGSTLIAPSADPVAAVANAVRSAFGGPAEARTARVVVLLGNVGRSKRLRRLFADAVRSLRVGDSGADAGSAVEAGSAPAADPLAFDVGPLPAPPGEAGLRALGALGELEPGEEWLVEPEQLDQEGRLWRPGVRIGLRRDARFWADAAGMPVIGVIRAGSLAEAIELQNRLGGGSVAALHATDPSETLPWLDGVRAAALSIGRATTDARIERQPGGGWNAAGMGGQPLAGGPNRLVALGSWELREGTPSSTLHLRGLDPEVQTLIETAQASLDYPSFDRLRRAALADALTWRTSLGRVHDGIGLGVERNLLRCWPVGTHVRLSEDGATVDLLRVLAAGLLSGAPLTLSTGVLLPPEISAFLDQQGIAISLERDDAWLERMAVAGAGLAAEAGRGGAGASGAGSGSGVGAGSGLTVGVTASGIERVRLIGGDPVRAAEWLGGQDRLPLWAEPVTMAGPVELLVFLREQSLSIAAHRYGLALPLEGVDERLAELDAGALPAG